MHKARTQKCTIITKKEKHAFKEARVRFRVWVRYGGTTILRKVEYWYGGDICFIKFFYILLCIHFSYIDKHM